MKDNWQPSPEILADATEYYLDERAAKRADIAPRLIAACEAAIFAVNVAQEIAREIDVWERLDCARGDIRETLAAVIAKYEPGRRLV